jgi:hypothetical protein
MKNKNNISENIEKEAPFLSKIEKKNHFSIPENYFKVLPEVITNKNVNNSSLQYFFDKLSHRILIPFSTVTAIVLLLFYFTPTPSSTEMTSEQISEILINDNYIELEEDLIIETYSKIVEETEISTNENHDNETEEYINYLIENDIDINSIITEL